MSQNCATTPGKNEAYMNSLLIIEPHMNGHHGVYLRWIVQGAVERNFRVFLGTFEDSVTHPLFKNILEEYRDALEIITLSTPDIDYMKDTSTGGLVRRELAYRKLFRRFYHKTLQRTRPDFVLLPFLDYCTYAIALLGSPFGQTPWAGIVMRPAFHYKVMGIIGPRSLLLMPKKLLFFHLLAQKKLRSLFTIDPSLFEYLKTGSSSSGQKAHYLRDPSEFKDNIEKDVARRLLCLPKDAIVLLVYGTINYRKGVDALLSAAAHPNFPANVHILLAGRQGPKAERLLCSNLGEYLMSSGRLHVINKYLADEEESIVFKAADIVWLVHRKHYTMSGTLVQAGRIGLPIVACEEGLIGWFAKKYDLGVLLYGLDERSVIDAIWRLVKDKEKFVKYGNAARKCFAEHTSNNFVADIFQQIV